MKLRLFMSEPRRGLGSGRDRGALLNNQGALAQWVMRKPAVFEVYARTQRVVDRIAGWMWLKEEDPAFWAEVQEAIRGWARSPHSLAYWEKMAAG